MKQQHWMPTCQLWRELQNNVHVLATAKRTIELVIRGIQLVFLSDKPREALKRYHMEGQRFQKPKEKARQGSQQTNARQPKLNTAHERSSKKKKLGRVQKPTLSAFQTTSMRTQQIDILIILPILSLRWQQNEILMAHHIWSCSKFFLLLSSLLFHPFEGTAQKRSD